MVPVKSPLFFLGCIFACWQHWNRTAISVISDTIRQSFYAVPLQKYDANTALEFLSGLLVVEYFWAGWGEWPGPSTPEQGSSRTLSVKLWALHMAASSEMLLLDYKSRAGCFQHGASRHALLSRAHLLKAIVFLFPTLLKCVLPVCICSLSSLLK